MHSFLEAEARKLRGQGSEEQGPGGENFEHPELGILREVITADVHDNSRTPIDRSNFFE
jgi:hypothetical protein